jgi:hypothetical protein
MGLEWVGAGRGPLALPDPDVAWISTDRAGRVLATTRDGRAFIADRVVPGHRPVWRPLVPAGPSRASPPPTMPAAPLAFGTLTGDGSRAAFVAAEFAAGSSFEVVIVETTEGAMTVDPIARPADGAPPAWLGDRLVVLTRERGDAPGATILDPTTGRVTDGPGPPAGRSGSSPDTEWSGPIAGLAVSADGSRVAVGASADGRVEIHPAVPWFAGAATRPAVVRLDPEVDGSREFSWLALAPGGDRLAVVRTNADGDAAGVEIRTAADDWRTTDRLVLPAGAIRAVVAWLP